MDTSTTDEDFNAPSLARQELLPRLQALLGDVPPHFWAACQLCPLEKLAQLVGVAQVGRDVVLVAAAETYSMIRSWNQAQSRAATTTTPGTSPMSLRPRTSPLLHRSTTARNQTRLRDSHSCVITGMNRSLQVAHIYPFSLLSDDGDDGDRSLKRIRFWQCLRMFYPADRIAAWEAALFPRGLGHDGVETTKNMITMGSSVHALWNLGAFALKPISISDDQKTLKLLFVWQVKQSAVMSDMDLTTIPQSTRNLDRYENCYLHRLPQTVIRSGSIVTLTTDDPDRRPLPSIALLEMQWFLQRIMGMAGAADVDSDEEYFSDDDMRDDALSLGDSRYD